MDEEKRFSETDHTADRALIIQANDLENLFLNALAGMYSIAGIHYFQESVNVIEMEFSADSLEDLLVDFLSEALYYLEVEELVFGVRSLIISDNILKVSLDTFKLKSIQKEIKAVTYADLKIEKTNDGYQVKIVFDV